MEVNFAPDLQSKLNDLAVKSGKPAHELVHDAVAGYVDTLADLRGMLDSRYEEIKSGRVQPIDGEDAFSRLQSPRSNSSR